MNVRFRTRTDTEKESRFSMVLSPFSKYYSKNIINVSSK